MASAGRMTEYKTDTENKGREVGRGGVGAERERGWGRKRERGGGGGEKERERGVARERGRRG